MATGWQKASLVRLQMNQDPSEPRKRDLVELAMALEGLMESVAAVAAVAERAVD